MTGGRSAESAATREAVRDARFAARLDELASFDCSMIFTPSSLAIWQARRLMR